MTDDATNLLFRSVRPGGHWRDTAIVGGDEDDGMLAAGYFKVADIAVEHWQSHGPNDLLAIPILENYRHGIELALKDVIRAAARCVRHDGANDVDLEVNAVDARLAATHSIGQLASELNTHLARLNFGEETRQLPPDVERILRALHLLDEKGQTFRYSTVKKQRRLVAARPRQTNFDLVAAAEALRDAGHLVLHGVSGVLEQYAEYQAARADGWC